MEPVLLDDERRRFFDENGYLVVPGALRPEEVGALADAADKLIDDFERQPGQAYVQRRPGIVEEPAFHPLLAHSSTLPLVVQLLSPNLHLHTAAIIYKWPQDEADGDARTWHRDIGMTEDIGHAGVFRAGIKVGYCLTDFPEPRSGFTLFAPGSHRLTTPLPIPKGAVDPDGVVDLCLSAGDAFLFRAWSTRRDADAGAVCEQAPAAAGQPRQERRRSTLEAEVPEVLDDRRAGAEAEGGS